MRNAQLVQEILGDAVVVTVFPDNKKYLSTDLMKEKPIRDQYLAPSVELKGLLALPRVCAACGRGD